MLCYVMLCYVMLCYVMLCYVMLCYVMLCYVTVCASALYVLMLLFYPTSRLVVIKVTVNNKSSKRIGRPVMFRPLY